MMHLDRKRQSIRFEHISVAQQNRRIQPADAQFRSLHIDQKLRPDAGRVRGAVKRFQKSACLFERRVRQIQPHAVHPFRKHLSERFGVPARQAERSVNEHVFHLASLLLLHVSSVYHIRAANGSEKTPAISAIASLLRLW